MFVLDLFTPVYPLCNWVSLSFFINEFLLLIKKKEKRNRVGKRVNKHKTKKKKKKKRKRKTKKKKKILGIKKLYFYLMK